MCALGEATVMDGVPRRTELDAVSPCEGVLETQPLLIRMWLLQRLAVQVVRAEEECL